MGKHDKEPTGDGEKKDYDHSKTKPVEESSSGERSKDDKGDDDK